jgi:hypothetical protein
MAHWRSQGSRSNTRRPIPAAVVSHPEHNAVKRQPVRPPTDPRHASLNTIKKTNIDRVDPESPMPVKRSVSHTERDLQT